MMVIDSIFLKMALIYPGRNYRHITDIQSRHCLGPLCKGLLKTDFKWLISGPFPQTKDIASQIDNGALYPLLFKIFFHAVCNIPFGDRSQINRYQIICKNHCIAVYRNSFISYL